MTRQEHITQDLRWQGRHVRLTWIPASDPAPFEPWSQVYGICFTSDGRILIIKDTHWTLPGGGREEGEAPEETLRREVKEEATTTIARCAFLGAQEVHDPDKPDPRPFEKGGNHFQLRFAAIIDEMFPPEPDPDSGVTYERKLIAPSEFLRYVPWGPTGEAMLRGAVAWFEKTTRP